MARSAASLDREIKAAIAAAPNSFPIRHYLTMVGLAVKWASGHRAHSKLAPYLVRVPKTRAGEESEVDRGFWLGEIVGDILADARKNLNGPEYTEFERRAERML